MVTIDREAGPATAVAAAPALVAAVLGRPRAALALTALPAAVALFFREETERVDYALIVNNERRYGLDNLGGWHEHPVLQPDIHLPVAAPTPEEALFSVRRAIETLDAR